MIDLELIDGLADDVRAMLAEERRSFEAAIKDLRAELTSLDERIKAIPAPIEGPQGKTGEKGETGPPGESIKGDKGDRGSDGGRGIDGRDGRDGKDGIASHDELKTLVQTEVEKGLSIGYDNERRLTIGGKSFVLPILLDRGVYKEGTEYEKGDCVTFGGSLWIAQAELSADKPGTSDAWRLSVKKGRDGRDAR